MIDTNNKKLSMMEWCIMWEPGLPMSPGTLGQDDQQQLLWDYPGILWGQMAQVARNTIPGFINNTGTLMNR